MAHKQPVISVPDGIAMKLAEEQKCGLTTVYQALRYASNSKKAQRIRQLATTVYGGVEVKKAYF